MSYFACLLSVVSFFVVVASGNFDVMFISDVFCGKISDVIYNVRKLGIHFCKCHLWYKRNLLTFFYLRFIIVFDHQTVSVSATAVTEYSVIRPTFGYGWNQKKWLRWVSSSSHAFCFLSLGSSGVAAIVTRSLWNLSS